MPEAKSLCLRHRLFDEISNHRFFDAFRQKSPDSQYWRAQDERTGRAQIARRAQLTVRRENPLLAGAIARELRLWLLSSQPSGNI